MEVIVFPDDSFASSISSLKESAQLMIAIANTQLDELLPNNKLRMMLLDELTKAHQIVQECEKRGVSRPFVEEMDVAESKEVDDWGNPVMEEEQEQNVAITKRLESADICKAINVRRQMNVLKEILHGDKQQIFEIAKSQSQLFEQDQLEVILELTAKKKGPKPFLLQRLRHQPQIFAMVLSFTFRKASVQQYLWSISWQSRHFLDRHTQQIDSPNRERWSLENKFLTQYLVDWSNATEQLHAIYFEYHERKLDIVLSQYRECPHYVKDYVEPEHLESQTISGDRFIRSLCHTSIQDGFLQYMCMLCKHVLDAYITAKHYGNCVVNFRNLNVRQDYTYEGNICKPKIHFSFGSERLLIVGQYQGKNIEVPHNFEPGGKQIDHEFTPPENCNGTCRERQEAYSLVMIYIIMTKGQLPYIIGKTDDFNFNKMMFDQDPAAYKQYLLNMLVKDRYLSQFQTWITKRLVSFICYSLSSDPIKWQDKRDLWLQKDTLRNLEMHSTFEAMFNGVFKTALKIIPE
ncbi:hypothetical protein FGO68_gene5689 [Halteria grandinella]|uniref:Uncharacterized protein n=1 Tax=Halteria grandinella TaxID=5974 RepID=A0A8J8T324_HALGN|nr:hypothetical protein FGO68_gene5689 [Halteria grandinella]